MINSLNNNFVLLCDNKFHIKEIVSVNKFELVVSEGDLFTKMILAEDLSRFFDFRNKLFLGKSIFNFEIAVNNGAIMEIFSIGGLEYKGDYIIFGYNKSESTPTDISSGDIISNNPDLLSKLNNEITNMHREMAKKNVEIKILLRESERMNRELEILNSTKDRIFSIIGHDLRSPLASIISVINLIMITQEDNKLEVIESCFPELKSLTLNSMELLDNLLDWAKSNLGVLKVHPTIFLITDLVEETLKLYDPLIKEKKIEVIKKYEINSLAYADVRMISTVIRNLISNALKYTNELGKIEIHFYQETNLLKLSVRDYGIGISNETKTKLFKEEIKNSTIGTNGEKGSGFGLLLIKNLIELNSGNIYYESELGKGSEFTITIPISE